MAMTIADIRAKYPEAYKDVSDQALADAIYNKYYPTADRREFDARIGLKPYDDLGQGIAKGFENIIPSTQQSLAGMGEMAGEFLTDAANREVKLGMPTGNFGLDLMNLPSKVVGTAIGLLPEDTRKELAYQGAVQSLRGQLANQAAEKNLQTVDAPPLSPASIASTVITSGAQMVPAIAASVLLKNPTPALAAGGVQAGGQAYAQGRDNQIDWQKGFFDQANKAGLTPDQARQYAGFYAAAEMIPEMLPLGVMLKEGTGGLISRMLKTSAAEGVSEGITQAAQSALDKGYVKPGMTWGEAWPQIVQAMAAGAIMGLPFGAIAHGGHAVTGEPSPAPAPDVVNPVVQPQGNDTPIEDQLALPAPQTPLALPSPEQFKEPVINRRQPQLDGGLPAAAENAGANIDERDYQARVALQKTKQTETDALLRTARETITPLGTFTSDEIGADAAGKVRARRVQTGRPVDAPVTIDELAAAKVPQKQIDAVIRARRPMTNEAALTPLDIKRAADAKNIIPSDSNFAELAYRTTGQRNVERMTQAQLHALKTTLESMPAHPAPVTVPVADAPVFTEEHYNKALDAIRKDGRYTAKAIKDATGLKANSDAAAIRDAMVRRGQLVQRGKNDFRLYDVVGRERQGTPADLPPGAFSEFVTRRIPVSKVRIRQDGESVGTFGSASEARGRVRDIRATEEQSGSRASSIAIEPAGDTAWGVLENRYDENGNLLGQAVVSTHKTEGEAQAEAGRMGAPADTGARYEQTAVEPTKAPQPTRQIVPAALEGRLPEVLKRLNQQARERRLPLLGVKVRITPNLTAEGEEVEGIYWRKLMQLTAQNLTADMSTDEVVNRLAGVMDHETIHALRAAGVLGPETEGWKAIVRYARRAKRPGTGETYLEWSRRNYKGVPGYETPDSIEEEAIAEAFRAWAANKRNVVGQPATVFRQIVEWFRRLFNAIPEDAFSAIETGRMVDEALRPPGSNEPRARATTTMQEAATGAATAQQAGNEAEVRARSREYLKARAQAREDRYGRSGPKTVLGTTPTRAYETADIADRDKVAGIADRYRQQAGISTGRLKTYLPLDQAWLKRVADAQQKGVHDPSADGVAKAYRALIDETRAMWRALGEPEVTAWTTDGQPYASPAEMLNDIAAGRLKMRLSNDMFGPGADNPGHPMNAASGYKTVGGQDLTNNDLFRIVHDVYGHGQSGFRDDARGAYNAYHEHARLLSPLARQALATETLAQRAWQDFGPHMRRKDGSVPRETDVDYLPPAKREFAEQKAFLADSTLLEADPGWAIADAAATATEDMPRYMVGWHGSPHTFDKFSSDKIGTGEGAQAFGHGLYFAGRKGVAEYYRNGLSSPKVMVKDAQGTVFDAAQHPEPAVRAAAGYLEEAAGDIDAALKSARANAEKYPTDRIPRGAARALEEWKQVGDFTVENGGRLYKVDLPSDDELMDWDKPLSEQPPSVLAKLREVAKKAGKAKFFDNGTSAETLARERLSDWARGKGADMTGETFYTSLARALGKDAPSGSLMGKIGDKVRDEVAASAALREVGIPGHRFLDQQSRLSGDANALIQKYGTREKALEIARQRADEASIPQHRSQWEKIAKELETEQTHNYVIYDDSRIEILETDPKYSKFADDLPGGRLYGNPNRSPGGALSKPGTPQAKFSAAERPGNRFFGGELAEHQLQMARRGIDGATMVYLPPEAFLSLANPEPNPEQAVYDAALAEGYKLSGMPSLVIDGYAGIVRAVQSDGTAGVRALNTPDAIPVVLYPRKAEQGLGLVTAFEANGQRVPWPHDGRAENFPAERPNSEPKYSLRAPFGQRLPTTPPTPMFNIVQQRTETAVGRFLKGIGRNKNITFKGVSIFDVREKLQDKMLSWKELNEYVTEQGGTVDDLNDAYMLEQLYHGKVFFQISEREKSLQLPLLEALKAAHDGPKHIQPSEFEDYLYARHAPERNAYLRSRGAPDPNPSGMSDAEAQSILDRFALDGKLPELEALAALADRITADTTRTRVEAGLISQQAADSSPYQYYVPLRGFAEEDLDPNSPTDSQVRARSGKGFSVGGREDRSVTGRGRKAGDLLGHLFLQNTEAVIRAQKNEVALAAMRLIQDNNSLSIGEILRTAPTRRVVSANGMIQEAGDPTYRQQPDIITAKWGGKEIIARLADPRLARAIKSDYVTSSNGVVRAFGAFNRYLAMMNTSINPPFIISNLARDLQTAGMLSAQYDIKGFGGKVIGNAPKAMGGIREVLRAGTANGEWAQAFREMQEAGGTTEFMGIHDLETQVQRIRKTITRTGWQTTPRKVANYIGEVFSFIDDYNKVAENAFRLSAYKAARDAGASIPQAAYLAKNLTVNFNKGGEWKTAANAMYLFYNAGVQGSVAIANGLKNKKVQRLVAGLVVAGALQDILNRVLGGGDDDKNGVPDYDDIPDYVLEHNFVVMDPLHILKSAGIDRGYFSLPMPYGFNAFYNLGRNISAAMSGSPVRSPGAAAANAATAFLDAFNPLGGAQSIWNFLSPTFLDPFVDNWTNQDFSGKKIVPERYNQPGGEPVPDSQKYWSTADPIAVNTAQQLNALTGGNEVRKGAVDISPETLEYLFDYATGGLGKFVERATRLGMATPDMLKGDFSNVDVGEIPFVNRLVGGVGPRNNESRYYDTAKAVLTTRDEIKMFAESGKADLARKSIADHPLDVKMIPLFESSNKALADLRKQLRDLRDNPNVPADRRNALEKKIKDAMDQLMAQVNKTYFEQKKLLSTP